MNVRARPAAEETAARILDVAEEHFRRVGYAKTAIADIAEELGMSSANVYRYFPSKSAINEAICGRLLDECHAMMAEIVAREAPAGRRLHDLLVAMHDYNKSRYTSERRMHDMVAAAMDENWGIIQDHLDTVVRAIARLIEEGVAAGEFKPVADSVETALTVKQCCTCMLHPLNIAEQSRFQPHAPNSAPRLAAFVVAALKS